MMVMMVIVVMMMMMRRRRKRSSNKGHKPFAAGADGEGAVVGEGGD